MRVAVIADIHGNTVALDAVLADIASETVDQIICLGDVAATGPQPVQAIERVRELGCPVIMGNTDAWLLDPQPYGIDSEAWRRFEEIDRWCAEQLSQSQREFLQSFLPHLNLDMGDGKSLLCFHGSPNSFDDVIYATTPDEELARMLEGFEATVMVGGHTHMQMYRRYRETVVVNVGSVGMAIDRVPPSQGIQNIANAEYGLMSAKHGQLEVELRRVPYDLDALTESVMVSEMPHADWWIGRWRSV